MSRSLRAAPASILAVLLFVFGLGFQRQVIEPSAWHATSVAGIHPSLHSSDWAPRIEVRQQRRPVAHVVVLSAQPARRGAAIVASSVAYGHIAHRVDRSIVARGYDATAPPHFLS